MILLRLIWFSLRIFFHFVVASLDSGVPTQENLRSRAGAKTRGPLIVIYASSLEGTYAKVTAAGGKIVRETFGFPGGRRFHFSDPSGNELSVWSE